MKENKYLQNAKKNAIRLENSYTDATKKTKGKIGQSLKYVGRDIVVTAIGGALTGALIGRGALLGGIIVSGVGYYMGSQTATMFGAGMMASGGTITLNNAMNGVERDGVDGVKDRFNAFKENFKKQLFLDKLIPAKKTTAASDDATNGVGEVQYFRHPSSNEELQGGTDGLDFTEANRIEAQLEHSARQFSGTEDFSGTEEVSGTDEISGMNGDTEDKIF